MRVERLAGWSAHALCINNMTRIITLTSGNNAAGRTSIGINLAAGLAAAGKRVCLLELVVDTTAASARLDVPVISLLNDRLQAGVDEVPLAVPLSAGFDLVAGGSEEDWLWDLSADQLATMAASLRSLDDYDIVVIDAGAGTAQNQLAFSLASPELWLVITPEPASLSDAYTRLKLLYAEGYTGQLSILVNRAENHAVGSEAYNKFKGIAGYYLDMQVPLVGILGEVDEAVPTGIVPADTAAYNAVSAGFSQLVDHLLTQQDESLQLVMATYARRYLQAASGVGEYEKDNTLKPVFSAPQSPDDLQQQLDLLSDQVDELIAEIERLREADTAKAALLTIPAVAGQQTEERCSQACIAAMASHSEQVMLEGACFAIYHMQKTSGDAQRFAFHSIDDDVEEPEPQTHLS
jgi:flagellar biosynthesis protein FlhG